MTVKQPLFDVRREYKRRFGPTPYWEFEPGSPDRIDAVKLDNEWRAAWEDCKTAAIEAAFGI